MSFRDPHMILFMLFHTSHTRMIRWNVIFYLLYMNANGESYKSTFKRNLLQFVSTSLYMLFDQKRQIILIFPRHKSACHVLMVMSCITRKYVFTNYSVPFIFSQSLVKTVKTVKTELYFTS